jgi:transcriptional regulator with PAS, ATPase and Fis domain
MPENLIEAELFGHTKGAFTGAETLKKGLIRAAEDGVMFLDEIGDLPQMLQAKLLNVLQPIDGKRFVRSVGDSKEDEVTCRFVCATHRNLKDMMEKGLFREDLYARISTFELHIKPLKERRGDIIPILRAIGESLKIAKTNEFIEKYRSEFVNDDGIDLSLNVRSLERSLKRYSVLGRV